MFGISDLLIIFVETKQDIMRKLQPELVKLSKLVVEIDSINTNISVLESSLVEYTQMLDSTFRVDFTNYRSSRNIYANNVETSYSILFVGGSSMLVWCGTVIDEIEDITQWRAVLKSHINKEIEQINKKFEMYREHLVNLWGQYGQFGKTVKL